MSFIDSQGLLALVQASQQARARGGTLRIERPPALMARLLEITRLDWLFADPDDSCT